MASRKEFCLPASRKRHPLNQGDSKYCPQCQTVKPRTAFYRNSIRYDGVTSFCKGCRDATSKIRTDARYQPLRSAPSWRYCKTPASCGPMN